MVKAENLFTFAQLISIVQYILKQMIKKYFYHSVGIFLWILMLTSCLGSSTNEYVASKDAQIYSFKLTSSVDSSSYLSGTKFSIDQVKGQIFNRDSLPYLYEVDSVLVSITGASSLGYSKIEFKLRDNDSSYTWNGKDSVAVHRLKSIETTAEDGKTILKYDFKLNTHQQDPYIINWDKISDNYLANIDIQEQKTVSFKNKFITYYKASGQIRASEAMTSNAGEWEQIVVAGLPLTTRLSSVTSVVSLETPVLYAIDTAGSVLVSHDGALWNIVDTDYSVKTIYGELPFITGEFAILVAISVDGDLKFATTTDFESFDILNNLPSELPVEGFSSVSFDNPSVYSAKYILLYGGKDNSGTSNDDVWIIQKDGNEIKAIKEDISLEIDDAQLFLYDDKVYVLAREDNEENKNKENKFYFSRNYGLNWTWGGENQVVSEDMSPRKGASVISDSDNFIWIFGGESSNQSQVVDVWRGRLNKLAK